LRLFHVVWIVRKIFYCYDRRLRSVFICAARGGRAPRRPQGGRPHGHRRRARRWASSPAAARRASPCSPATSQAGRRASPL
jgi:hypothetical protein